MTSTCRRCHGQGRVISSLCKQCKGKGTTTRTQSVNVQVPAGNNIIIALFYFYFLGVSDGQTLRVPVGQTEAYITVRVSESDTFTRDGFDVHSDTVISFTQAVLGGSVRIQSLKGPLDVKVYVIMIPYMCVCVCFHDSFLCSDSSWHPIASSYKTLWERY